MPQDRRGYGSMESPDPCSHNILKPQNTCMPFALIVETNALV